MLTELRIENFKAWEDTGTIHLAPLTVFFGNNSSGKSSLNQLLLLLKQTAESPDRRRVIHFGDRKSLVDVGTYQDMVHAHDTERPVKFKVGWSLPDAIEVNDPRSEMEYVGDEITFSATVRHEGGTKGRVLVDALSYALRGSDDPPLTVKMKQQEGSHSKYELHTSNYNLVRAKGRAWPIPEPVRFYGFPDEAVAYYENTGFLPDLTLELEQQLSRLYYLGPLRETPARTYIWSGEVPDHVGWKGERVVEAVLAASDRKISRGYKKYYKPFQEVVARWLSKMGLIDEFAVEAIAKHRKEYEVNVRVSRSSSQVTLPDIGFGVSQVLPVIVQCFYAGKESSVILEQPEIHLHPSVQASLADLFVEAIHAREDGTDRNIQLLVESHSEHFLRRLQRLVATEQVDPSEVAIYFCQHRRGSASIEELEVDLFGRIQNWPKNFFGDIEGEVEARTKAMLDRMTEMEKQKGAGDPNEENASD